MCLHVQIFTKNQIGSPSAIQFHGHGTYHNWVHLSDIVKVSDARSAGPHHDMRATTLTLSNSGRQAERYEAHWIKTQEVITTRFSPKCSIILRTPSSAVTYIQATKFRVPSKPSTYHPLSASMGVQDCVYDARATLHFRHHLTKPTAPSGPRPSFHVQRAYDHPTPTQDRGRVLVRSSSVDACMAQHLSCLGRVLIGPSSSQDQQQLGSFRTGCAPSEMVSGK